MDLIGSSRCVNAMIFYFVTVAALSVMVASVTPTEATGVKNMVCDEPSENCNPSCRIGLVESIPENLTFAAGSPQHPSTYEAWCRLLDLASQSLDIAAFYWNMKGEDDYKDPSDWQGEDIFKKIYDAGKSRNIDIRIARSQPWKAENETQDIPQLEKLRAVKVRTLNFTRWFNSGVLHTKLWVVDNKHFYLGSANMDWRSLTQVKELGVVGYDCADLAADLAKIFAVYWYMGKPGQELPDKPWPHEYETKFNKDHPLHTHFNDTPAEVYFSSSPPKFCPAGRTGDIDAILDVIHKAKKFVHIAVMDYTPAIVFTRNYTFWPVIDDELRRVALDKKVEVCLLVAIWKYSNPDMFHYLKSLAILDGLNKNTTTLKVKLFYVPSYTEAQRKIPHARVNHNKYMVTDNIAYIGTSNWSGDYFTSTGGAGIIFNQTAESTDKSKETVRQQLEAIFERDWTSSHAFPVLEVEDTIIDKLKVESGSP